MDFGNTKAEVSYGSSLIPHGSVVKVVVGNVESGKTGKGEPKANLTLEALDNAFLGAKFYDTIGVPLQDRPITEQGYFQRAGYTAVKYMLETTDNAHLSGSYRLDSLEQLSGKTVVVKVKQEVVIKQNGDAVIVNKVDSYSTPRTDSSNHKIYEAWEKGEQPWQTDWKPELPASKPANNGYANNDFDGPPAGHPASF